MNDRRRFRRRRVLREGRLILEPGTIPIKCIIRDESDGGAKVRVPAQVELLPNLSLVFVTEGKMFPAEVIWRHKDDVGIAYVGSCQNAPPDLI